jgi:hypothetical protein
MDNPETLTTLDTKRRTKTIKTKKNNRQNYEAKEMRNTEILF